MNEMNLTPDAPQYWETLYEQGLDHWDLGEATPALLEFFEHPSCPKTGDVLVPAAGKGWDAEAFAKRGYNVLAVDFCPSALDSLEQLASGNSNLAILNLDMFLLNSCEERRGGKKFDIIYDYFGFNSIHPSRRDDYVEMLLRVIKDDGLLIGFFCPLCNEKYGCNPPYNISSKELEARFSEIMEIKERITPGKSVESRVGKEEIWLLRKIL